MLSVDLYIIKPNLFNPNVDDWDCHHLPRPTLAAAERLLLRLGGVRPHVIFYVPLETLVAHLRNYHTTKRKWQCCLY